MNFYANPEVGSNRRISSREKQFIGTDGGHAPWECAEDGTVGRGPICAVDKGVRLMVRDLVETTISGGLDPTIKKRLTDIVGLLQVYSRLAELEMAAREVPKFPGKGYVALPEDTAEKAKGWAEKARVMEGITGFNKNPRAALEAMGGSG